MRGWVRVLPFNDPRLSLLPQLPTWWLRGGGDGGGARAVRIESAKAHGAEIVAKIAGVDDRDAALALVGVEVLLSRAQFPAADDDEVYWADLIGCTVLDPDGESLGVVVAVEDQPAHPLMRVADRDGRQSGSDEAREAQAHAHDTRPNETRSEEARSEETRSEEARSDKARPGKARPGEARPREARPGEAPQPDRLIPLLPEFLLSVDLANRVVVADWRRDY